MDNHATFLGKHSVGNGQKETCQDVLLEDRINNRKSNGAMREVRKEKKKTQPWGSKEMDMEDPSTSHGQKVKDLQNISDISGWQPRSRWKRGTG